MADGISTGRHLLAAPCIFCDYRGINYFQSGSHDASCPWHRIGGMEAREALVADVVREKMRALRVRVYAIDHYAGVKP